MPAICPYLIGVTLALAAPQDGVPPLAAPPTVSAPVPPAPADGEIDEPPTPAAPPAPDRTGPTDATRSMADVLDALPGEENAPRGQDGSLPISGNPAAVNIVTGTGALGRLLGIDPESGFRLGGLWIGDASGVLAGGLVPGAWGLNSLTLVDLSLDTEKRWGWRGGLFGMQFLQFSGEKTNELAGAFPGFDSLQGPPPLVRQEIYQLWYRQALFDDRLIVRLGKTVPTYDFGNVARPVPVRDTAAAIPAVTGLIYTPIFVNPTMLGVIPGYYNSAVGTTLTIAPTERAYFSYGIYDGAGAGVAGRQTGLEGPIFNGSSFQIGEVGYAYRAGPQRKPGNFGVGIWGQIGMLKSPGSNSITGAQGLYLFGAHRLWFRNPGRDNSGVSGFYQFGANNTNALPARQYFGAGLTAFGLVPGRADDSFGFGLAQTWLNTTPGAASFFHLPDAVIPPIPGTRGPVSFRSSQLMLAWYYQWKVRDGCFFQPNLTYIPTPGLGTHTPGALALTFRLTVLF
jgi:porin